MKSLFYEDENGKVVGVHFVGKDQGEKEPDEEYLERKWAAMRARDDTLPEEFYCCAADKMPSRDDRENWAIQFGELVVVNNADN